MLRSGHDVAARRVYDQDSLPRRGGDVDVVHPDARSPDHAQFAAGLDDRRRHARFAAHDQRVEIRDPADELRLGELADNRDLARPTQALKAVLGQRIGDQNLRHGENRASARRRAPPAGRR